MKIQLSHSFEDIISIDNLFNAWREFLRGKRGKRDVAEFSLQVMDNIFALHHDLVHRIYQHGPYQSFFVNDPKRRHIHKASVRDRLLHHAIYRILYPFFERIFMADSFSCRRRKGMHKAINRFRQFGFAVSNNHTKTVWILKCDIRKFFASIDQGMLLEILREYIPDQNIMWLLANVIKSFSSEDRFSTSSNNNYHSSEAKRNREWFRVGLPLGNLTSQLFSNVYLNVFDQFVKHHLKAKHYVRYADDFVLMSCDREWLVNQVPAIDQFLHMQLRLQLHPDKIVLKTLAAGIDFLGWVHFPNYRVLRTTTKRRMLARVQNSPTNAVLQSYIGLLGHGKAYGLTQEMLDLAWLTAKNP